MILVSNVYHMLAYAFRSLNLGGIGNLGNEEFENIHELFSEIIIRGMNRQLKRGLPKNYKPESDELSSLRGKIDFRTSIRNQAHIRHKLECEFDEFTEDTPSNRLIKCALRNLLSRSDVSVNRKHVLKFIYSSLANVSDTSYQKIPSQQTGGAEYIMLVNICRFLLEGLLMKTNGGYKMRDWLTDEQMSSLYEHFLLEYFRYHHPQFNARPAQISWDMDVLPMEMPEMRSDVYLTNKTKTLIIDAKFYNHTMSEHFGKKTYHSNNLYQIYTYVKNADLTKSGNVSGMLLYAKTDEDITPNSDNVIGGNLISVKTLDLSQNFSSIRVQLEAIANVLAQDSSEIHPQEV